MRKDFKKEAPCLLSLEGWIEFEYRGHLGTELPKKTSQGMEVKKCLIFSDNYEN